MIKVILFDFFGVLSTPVYKKVIDTYVPEADRAARMKQLDELDTGNLTEAELVRQLALAGGVSEKEIWQTAEAAPVVDRELVEYIQADLMPKYHVGLLTNIPRSLLEKIFGEHVDGFDPVITSSDVGLAKPDPKIFELACERCGVQAGEIAFIDDSEKNIIAAREIGIKAIQYFDLPTLKQDFEKYGISETNNSV